MKTKAQVQADLNLDSEPTDEFMQLLEELGEGPIAAPIGTGKRSKDTPPKAIRQTLGEAIVAQSLREVLTQARAEEEKTLAEVGAAMGISRSRVGHIEAQDNFEISTLVGYADAVGYDVMVTLTPRTSGKKTFTTKLLTIKGTRQS